MPAVRGKSESSDLFEANRYLSIANQRLVSRTRGRRIWLKGFHCWINKFLGKDAPKNQSQHDCVIRGRDFPLLGSLGRRLGCQAPHFVACECRTKSLGSAPGRRAAVAAKTVGRRRAGANCCASSDSSFQTLHTRGFGGANSPLRHAFVHARVIRIIPGRPLATMLAVLVSTIHGDFYVQRRGEYAIALTEHSLCLRGAVLQVEDALRLKGGSVAQEPKRGRLQVRTFFRMTLR